MPTCAFQHPRAFAGDAPKCVPLSPSTIEHCRTPPAPDTVDYAAEMALCPT